MGQWLAVAGWSVLIASLRRVRWPRAVSVSVAILPVREDRVVCVLSLFNVDITLAVGCPGVNVLCVSYVNLVVVIYRLNGNLQVVNYFVCGRCCF